MTDISSSIPTEIRAGDSVKWRREFSDYPASDGWSLAYSMVGSAGVISASANADGDSFLVSILSSASAAWAAGLYSLVEYVSKGSERITLTTQPWRVLPNLAAATVATDVRTHARKVLDAIEAWLESKAPTAASFEIAGRKLQNYPLPELLALRDRYRAEVLREDRAAQGFGSTRLLTRFQ